MSDFVKGAIVVAAAIIIAVGMWIYFSPLQTCIRTVKKQGLTNEAAKMYCVNR